MDLWGELALDMDLHRVVALVGGGGKTSSMYALARQARDAGRTVIVTTTTHIRPHSMLPLTDNPDPEHLQALLAEHGIITLGRFLRPDKISDAGGAAVCKAVADVVVVEADGARQLPLKVPADHEPVIPECTDVVIAVAGMDCVGRSIESICHRPERVCALLGKSPEDSVSPENVTRILSHPRGGRKGVRDEMAFRCLLNKADTPQRLAWAEEIQSQLAAKGIRSVMTRYSAGERGGRSLFQ